MAEISRGATLKIERANKHIAELRNAIVALEEKYTSRIHVDPRTGVQNLIHTVPDLDVTLQNLSLIVGDAVHNLRAALDFAWFDTIERIGVPKSSRDKRNFPIRKTQRELEDALRGIDIDTLFPDLFKLLVFDIKPYEGPHPSIVWVLHNLDIADKHMFPLELSSLAEIRGVKFREKGGEISFKGGMATQQTGPHVIPFEPEVTIEDNGKLSLAITFKEAGAFHHLPVVALLPGFGQYVFHIVKQLAQIAQRPID
jgi:hypothetical protein